MRYASIRSMDISNGKGVGVSLFVQGCLNHCYNCFNPETWDFNGGKQWTKEVQDEFLRLVSQPFVTRISILGGEPLAYENLPDVYDLLEIIKKDYPDKKIWLWTGFELNISNFNQNVDICWDNGLLRNYILGKCDYVIDGRYIDELKNYSLAFRGSSNQRIIDVQKTIKLNKIVEYEDD